MVNISRRLNKVVAGVVLVLFCSASLTGCASFRRKFIRQNKNKDAKEDFIPVLEPVEYQPVVTSPMDSYKSHYAMVKAYFSDVYAALASRDPSEKRERYLIDQIIAHLRGMEGLLSGDRKLEVQKVAGLLDGVLKELDKPSGLQRQDLLKGSVHKVETDIRSKLKPDMVKEFIAVP